MKKIKDFIKKTKNICFSFQKDKMYGFLTPAIFIIPKQKTFDDANIFRIGIMAFFWSFTINVNKKHYEKTNWKKLIGIALIIIGAIFFVIGIFGHMAVEHRILMFIMFLYCVSAGACVVSSWDFKQ